MNSNLFLLAAVAGVAVVGPIQARSANQQSPPEPLEVDMFYQYSATDDDAEVTIDVESSIAIDSLTVLASDGHRVMYVRSGDNLGLREIEVESDERDRDEVRRGRRQQDIRVLRVQHKVVRRNTRWICGLGIKGVQCSRSGTESSDLLLALPGSESSPPRRTAAQIASLP